MNNSQQASIGSSTIHLIEQHLSKRYDFRYNVVTSKVEFRSNYSSLGLATKFEPMEDYDYNSIFCEIVKADIKCNITVLRSVLKSDFVQKFDPFQTYLKNLPAWDGKTDYIGMKAATVKTTNQEFWIKCFTKWFVAMTASLHNNKIVNHTAVIFSGKQGIGKTTWIMGLVPDELSDYKYSGTINFYNKDSQINLAECMLINLDELENMNDGEIGRLKEGITKPTILMRRPYGYVNEVMIRRASFAGSVNSKEFLNDITGNRRFLCFEALEMDYKTIIPLDKMFAQALHLHKNGFKHWFDQDELVELNNNNDEFKINSIEEEALLQHYEPCKEEEATDLMPTTKLAQVLSGVSNLTVSGRTIQKLGKLLNSNGFIRLKKNQKYVYALKARNVAAQEAEGEQQC